MTVLDNAGNLVMLTELSGHLRLQEHVLFMWKVMKGGFKE